MDTNTKTEEKQRMRNKTKIIIGMCILLIIAITTYAQDTQSSFVSDVSTSVIDSFNSIKQKILGDTELDSTIKDQLNNLQSVDYTQVSADVSKIAEDAKALLPRAQALITKGSSAAQQSPGTSTIFNELMEAIGNV